MSLEEDVVSGLRAVCGEPAQWSSKGSVVLDLQQRQPFWQQWQVAGFDCERLRTLIPCLRAKHCDAREQRETKGKRKASPASAGDARKVCKTSVASDEQRTGVQALLCEICGEEPDLWNTKMPVVKAVQRSPVGQELQEAGLTVVQLKNMIQYLKDQHLRKLPAYHQKYSGAAKVRNNLKVCYSEKAGELKVRYSEKAGELKVRFSEKVYEARQFTFEASTLVDKKFTRLLTAEAKVVQVANAIELGMEDLHAASLNGAVTYVGLSKLRYCVSCVFELF